MKKILNVSSIVAIIAGAILVIGGVWGIFFTYKNIAQEKITTPQDASISQRRVLGPFTLKAQADIIRKHTLESTQNKTFAEMPRQIQKTDDQGSLIFDSEGKPVMVPNTSRDIWITATTLTTALNLGILTYVFSALIILLGFISIWTGIVFRFLANREAH